MDRKEKVVKGQVGAIRFIPGDQATGVSIVLVPGDEEYQLSGTDIYIQTARVSDADFVKWAAQIPHGHPSVKVFVEMRVVEGGYVTVIEAKFTRDDLG